MERELEGKDKKKGKRKGMMSERARGREMGEIQEDK